MRQDRCDLLIDYFNRDLDETEELGFKKHLRTCLNCQEQCKELEELTRNLPYTSKPIAPPAGMKKAFLSICLKKNQPELLG